MKKLSILLAPVMPGFEAWAVNGFVEDLCEPNDSKNGPDPFDPEALKKLVDGFTTPNSNLLFAPADKLGSVVSSMHERSLGVSVRPLDRGGLLVSGIFPSEKWKDLCEWLGVNSDVNAAKNVSE